MISFAITSLIIIGITVSAIGIGLNAQNVKYRKNNEAKSLKEVVDDLYEKADECYGYSIGDEITVNGEHYYVISDSPATQDYVVALKDTFLTTNELNTYGSGHINVWSPRSRNVAHDLNDVNHTGGMSYYTSETCGYVNDTYIYDGCINLYDSSDVKYVIDNWSNAIFNNKELKEINEYKARLITVEEYRKIPDVYNWRFGITNYWTMTPTSKTNNYVRVVRFDTGGVMDKLMLERYVSQAVRPVINVYKSAITRVNSN